MKYVEVLLSTLEKMSFKPENIIVNINKNH